MRFLSLSPKAQAYYEGLEQRRANARHHLRKIVALSEIYGAEAVARAIEDGARLPRLQLRVHRQHPGDASPRAAPTAGALHLTRRQDLLEIEIAAPDLSLYERE